MKFSAYLQEAKDVAWILKDRPTEIKHLDCSDRELISLRGSPEKLEGFFDCSMNRLKNLKGGPRVVGGDYDCQFNRQLTSLEGIAEDIGADLICYGNPGITNLHNIHKLIKRIGANAMFNNTPIKSHVLGLLLIKDLHTVVLDDHKVAYLVNEQLKGDRDVMALQQALFDNNLDEYAQL